MRAGRRGVTRGAQRGQMHLVASLQRLSLRREAQARLVRAGAIAWLVSLLLRADTVPEAPLPGPQPSRPPRPPSSY
jgi:hypothetical protein